MKAETYEPKGYWEKRLSNNFTLSGVGFWGLGVAYNCWLYKARLRALSKLLRRHKIDVRGKRVLDLGVGNGFYIEYWKKMQASSISGVDITDKSISSLKTKYPEYEFMQADISSTGLCIQGTFDLITVFDVLFHIVDEEKFEQAIDNIRKLATRDTKILLTDSFLKEAGVIGFHENHRTLQRYQEVLSETGFKMIDLRPVFYVMNNPIDMASVRSRFLRRLIPRVWIFTVKILNLSNSRVARLLRTDFVLGHALGLVLYLWDGLAMAFATDGPSSKLLLVQLESDGDPQAQ
jgi:SAM-dependent methyltransferase